MRIYLIKKKTVLSVSRSLQLTTFQTWISHENTNRIIQKKSAYSVYVYGVLDVRLFPNKRLNVDLKNIEIWVSHGLNDGQNFGMILLLMLMGKNSDTKNSGG